MATGVMVCGQRKEKEPKKMAIDDEEQEGTVWLAYRLVY